MPASPICRVVLAGTVVLGGQAGQRPTIRSGVELALVDVQVVDRRGNPMLGLDAADFEVWIGGERRPVESAELVRYDAARPSDVPRSTDPAVASSGAPRRMFVVAVDEHSLRVGNARAAMEAARRFIDRLDPDDLLSLYAYPTGAVRTDLTTDHANVKSQLGKIMGLWERPLMSLFHLSPSEIIDIASGDRDTTAAVARRECGRTDRTCMTQLLMEAQASAIMFEMKIDQSLGGLRGLIESLRAVPGRKTLVLVSGGLLASDRAGGRVAANTQIAAVGREAAAANVTVYVLHMDASFLDAFSADGRPTPTLFRDANMMATGLELVAGAAGGEVFRVQTGYGDEAFTRVLRENAAYYLLGVGVSEAERDGRPRAIRVRVRRSGATVRNRGVIVVPRTGPRQ